MNKNQDDRICELFAKEDVTHDEDKELGTLIDNVCSAFDEEMAEFDKP